MADPRRNRSSITDEMVEAFGNAYRGTKVANDFRPITEWVDPVRAGLRAAARRLRLTDQPPCDVPHACPDCGTEWFVGNGDSAPLEASDE